MSEQKKHPAFQIEEIARAFGVPESKIQLLGVNPAKRQTLNVPLELVVLEPNAPKPGHKGSWRDPWAVVSLGTFRLATFKLHPVTGALEWWGPSQDEADDPIPVNDYPDHLRFPADVEGLVLQQLQEARQRSYRIRAEYYAALANSGAGER